VAANLGRVIPFNTGLINCQPQQVVTMVNISGRGGYLIRFVSVLESATIPLFPTFLLDGIPIDLSRIEDRRLLTFATTDVAGGGGSMNPWFYLRFNHSLHIVARNGGHGIYDINVSAPFLLDI
jgi:hypothetical protein